MFSGLLINFTTGFLAGFMSHNLVHKLETLEGPTYKNLTALMSGLLYAGLFLKYAFTLQMVLSALLVSVLLLVFIIDLKTQNIPNELNMALTLLGTASLLVQPSLAHLLTSAVGALSGGGFLLLIAILTRGAIGGGDIKMLFGLGLFFGPGGVLVICMLSFIGGALVAAGLLLTHKKGMKDFMPFGPLIVTACFVQLFFGEGLLTWLGF